MDPNWILVGGLSGFPLGSSLGSNLGGSTLERIELGIQFSKLDPKHRYVISRTPLYPMYIRENINAREQLNQHCKFRCVVFSMLFANYGLDRIHFLNMQINDRSQCRADYIISVKASAGIQFRELATNRRFKSHIFQDSVNDFRAFATLKWIKTVSKWFLKSFQSFKISQKVAKSTFSVQNHSNFDGKCEISNV